MILAVKYPYLASLEVWASRLICRCSVGYTHCWVSGTKSGLSLTQRLWYCYLYLPVENPRSHPTSWDSYYFSYIPVWLIFYRFSSRRTSDRNLSPFLSLLEDVWKVKKSSSNGILSVDKNATALQEPCLNHTQVTSQMNNGNYY